MPRWILDVGSWMLVGFAHGNQCLRAGQQRARLGSFLHFFGCGAECGRLGLGSFLHFLVAVAERRGGAWVRFCTFWLLWQSAAAGLLGPRPRGRSQDSQLRCWE